MPVVPASQAEVNAGVVARKYVAPSTLAGWTGLSATNFARLNGTNIFTGTNTFHARLLLTNVAGAGTNLVLGPMVIAQTNGLVFFLSDYNGLTGPAWSITASGDAYFDNVGAGGVYSGDGSGLTNVPGAASTNANEYFDPQVWDAAKQQTNLFLLRSNVLVIPGIWQGATEPIGTGGAYLLFHTNAWLNGFYSDGVFVDVYAALSNTLNSPIFRFGDGGGTINASKVPLSVEGYLTVGGGFDALDYLILKPGGGAPWGLAMTNTAADGTTFTEQGVLVLSLTPTNVTVHTNLTVNGSLTANGSGLSNLNGSSVASGTNASTVAFGTVKGTNLWDRANGQWWGAIDMGESTVALQNAIYGATNLSESANGWNQGSVSGEVVIGPGMFTITNTLYLPVGVRLRGAGVLNSIIRNTSTNSSLVFVENMTTGIGNWVGVSGFTIYHSAANTETVGIDICATNATVFPTIRDVVVMAAGVGVRTKSSINLLMERVIARNCSSDGFQLLGTSTAGSVSACFASSNTGYGWFIQDAVYTAFFGLASDYNDEGGYLLDDLDTCTFSACGAEKNSYDQFYLLDCSNVNMRGLFPVGDAGSSNAIVVDGGIDLFLYNVEYGPAGNTNGYGLFLTNAPSNVQVVGEAIGNFGLGTCNDFPGIAYANLAGNISVGSVLTITNVTAANQGAAFGPNQATLAYGGAATLVLTNSGVSVGFDATEELHSPLTVHKTGDLPPSLTHDAESLVTFKNLTTELAIGIDAGYCWFQRRSDTYNGYSYALSFNPLGGNVGIGTVSPSAANHTTNAAQQAVVFQVDTTAGAGSFMVSSNGVASGNGSGFTNLNASSLASGTVADARLSTNVLLLKVAGTNDGDVVLSKFGGPSIEFTDTDAVSLGWLKMSDVGTNFYFIGGTVNAGSFAGDGSGLTGLIGLANSYDTIWISASGLIPCTTNPPAWGTNAPAGSDNETTDVLAFDDAQTESANISLVMPETWGLGTVKAKFYWTTAAASGNVVWSIAGGSIANDDALGAKLGTAVSLTNAASAAADQMISAATAAVTVASPGLGERVLWKVARIGADGGDTLTGDAFLQGVLIQFRHGTTNSTAW